jgi:2-oxoglutarate ferredoxin oxidoreductase subunit beta
VARWTSYHTAELTKAIITGLSTEGLSFIEAMVQCPTAYGRRNKLREVTDQVEWMRTHAILLQKVRRMEQEGTPIPEEHFTVGEFVRRHRPAMGVRR